MSYTFVHLLKFTPAFLTVFDLVLESLKDFPKDEVKRVLQYLYEHQDRFYVDKVLVVDAPEFVEYVEQQESKELDWIIGPETEHLKDIRNSDAGKLHALVGNNIQTGGNVLVVYNPDDQAKRVIEYIYS